MQKIEWERLSKQEIIDALHFKDGARETAFRYELLDKDDNKITDLNNVIGGEVSMASLSVIKRTARFDIDNDDSIDWLNNRIKVYARIKVKDIWIEWSIGIFLLSTPTRTERNGVIYRNVSAYDGLQVLVDDKVDSRFTILTGQNYVQAIISILVSAGIKKYNIENSQKQCPVSREWDIGTSKLTICNDLLAELNYNSLFVDEQGCFTANKYQLPAQRAIEYTYTDLTIIAQEIEDEIDYFSVPNKFIVCYTNPDVQPLVAIYINSNVESKTSTVNRGRVICDFRQINNIADQNALNDYCNKIGYEASQIYNHIRFSTAIMPFHSISDVIGINHPKLGINDKFIETSWTIPLNSGSMMSHEARRVVQA